MAFFPESKAHIDPIKFKPVDSKILQLMQDCGMCRGIFWSRWDKSSDVINSLPEDAYVAASRAIDPLERGYCVGIYQTQHPRWPGRTFTFVSASRDDKSYLYESPSGEPVPIPLLLKFHADRMPLWSWRSGVGIFGIIAALLAVSVGFFSLWMDHHYLQPGQIPTSYFIAPLAFVIMPLFVYFGGPRIHDSAVNKVKRESTELTAV